MKKKYVDREIATGFGRLYIDIASKMSYDKSLVVPPHNAGAFQALSPEVRDFVRDEMLDKAQNILSKVLKKNYNYAPAYFQTARLNLERRDLFTAERALLRALKYDRKRPEYNDLLGQVYAKRKLPDQAIKYFQDAIDVDYQYLPAHYHMAKLSYYDARNIPKALEEYQITRELLPGAPADQVVGIDSDELYYNLGWLEYQNSNYDEALSLWNNVLTGDLTVNPNLNFAAGNAYYSIGRYELAIQKFTAAVASYREMAKAKGAVEPGQDFDRNLWRDLSSVYNNLGVSFYLAGDQNRALQNLWKSVESIKTLGFFNENEQANINRAYLLHPPAKNVSGLLELNDDIPMDYRLNGLPAD